MIDLEQVLKPEPPRDRFGRYLVRLPGDKKPRGRTRVTTFIKALDQGDGLIAWKATATMVGALRNPGLMAKWAAVFAQSIDPWYANDTLKTTCKKLVDECADHGGAQSRASLGTALHTMVELVARHENGEIEMPVLVEPHLADISALLTTMKTAGISFTGHNEVCVYIEKYDLVGTFDFLLDVTGQPWEDPFITSDLKTEGSTDYKALNHAAQLASYGMATHRIIFPADPDDECTLEPLPPRNPDVGLIVHLPAGEARCELHAVDLAQGREALEVAAACRRLDAQRKRKDTGGLMRPWAELAPVAVQLAGDSGDAGADGPNPSAPATNQEELCPCPTSQSQPEQTSEPTAPSSTVAASTGSVNPPTTTSETTTATNRVDGPRSGTTLTVGTFDTFEGPPANPADVALAMAKHAALDEAQKARIVGWLREAAANPQVGRPFSLGGGWQTTRRLALVEASIAIVQEGWTDDDYRSLIGPAGHHPDTFTAPIGVLLGAMNHTQAHSLYLSIQHAARHKETTQ